MFLKFSAARFKTVVDSFRVSSSSLELATLRDAPVYVNWLSGAERLLSVLSVPSAGVGVPPGLGSFFSPPVVSPEPEVVSPLVSLPPEPVPPLSEPEVPPEPEVPSEEPVVPPSEPLLSGSELPAPVFLPSVWSFSVDWVSFSSPLPSEESLPLVSPG